jgi:tetratricopeptide (TPR) repeat protein
MLILFTSISVFSQATQTAGFYTPKLRNIDINEAKNNLTQILIKTLCSDSKGWFWNSRYPTKVEVFEDRFELTYKKENITFYFSQLLKYDLNVSVFSFDPGRMGRDIYLIEFNNIKFFSRKSDSESMKELTDYLFFYQKRQKDVELNKYNNQLSLFEEKATEYRALHVKPAISEEQREYIVQANLYTQQRNYNKAIELYQKVCQINSFAYPAAYSNLALLFANISDYQSAIYYMKLYLMLEPDASDSRASQDKIYEWKLMLQ